MIINLLRPQMGELVAGGPYHYYTEEKNIFLKFGYFFHIFFFLLKRQIYYNMICSYRVGIFTPNECEKHYLFLPKEERILLTSWSLTNKDVNLRTLLCRIECALSDNKTIALRRYMYNQLRRNEMCKKIQYTCTLRTKTVNCHIFIIRYHHNFFFRNALQMKI